MSAIDRVDGGAGIDTLEINTTSTLDTSALPTVKNVEIITVNSAAADVSGPSAVSAIVLDTTSIEGLTDLNVTKAVGTTDLTAGETTSVNVKNATGVINIAGGKNIVVNDKTKINDILIGDGAAGGNATGTIKVTDTDNSGANNITVEGGTDVTVTATAKAAVTGATTVGHATNGTASGDITVTQNYSFDGKSGDMANTGDILVTGGKTATITVNNTIEAADKNAGDDIDNSGQDIKVVSDEALTDVTVTQNQTITDFEKDAVAEVKATENITFKELAKGESVTVNNLTFNATKLGGLTAAEVAQAFANLTVNDTQEAGGSTANGYFTGDFGATGGVTGWTSGAANGATVTFTAPAHDTTTKLVVASSDAANSLPDTSAAIVAGTNTVGAIDTANVVKLSDVYVDDKNGVDATIKNITVDGFKDAKLGVANDLDALETLTLKNSIGDTTLHTASKQLSLTLDAMGVTATPADITLDAAAANVKTLTITTENTKSNVDLVAAALTGLTINAGADLDLSSTGVADFGNATIETVSITGAGAVDFGTILQDEVALNSFDASGNTGGITATVEAGGTTVTGDITDYTFSAGNDTITVLDTDSENKIDINIATGAGDDKVTLDSGINQAGATIDAGTGTNTLKMDAADAAIAAAGSLFEAKMSGFSKLEVTQALGNTNDTINLDNMDDISYVITNGLATGTGAQAEIQDFTVTAAPTAKTNKEQTIDFVGLSIADGSGGNFTIGGVTVTVNNIDSQSNGDTAAEIAAAVATALNGNQPTGTTQNVAASVSGTTVTIVFDTRDGDVAELTYGAGTATFTGGTPPTATESVAYADPSGNITVGGITVAVTAADKDSAKSAVVGTGDSAAEVAAAIETALGANATYDAANTSNTGADVTVQWENVGDQSAISFVDTDTTGVTISAITETQAGSSATTLTLDNMLDAGTVEMNGAAAAGTKLTVNMKDASGKTDTLNVITSGDIDVGTLEIDDVESINITTTETYTKQADGSMKANLDMQTLVVDGDAVETITVTGAGAINLTSATHNATTTTFVGALTGNEISTVTSSVLTLIDGSAMTGSLYAATNAADQTIKGGSADDLIIANAARATIEGGEGKDAIVVTSDASASVIDGGAGADTFHITGAALGLEAFATFNNVDSGDKFVINADTFSAAQVNMTLDDPTTTDWLNAAFAQTDGSAGTGEAIWFQHKGNTYIVDNTSNAGYDAGSDVVVKISGLVDLSTASFNATDHTIEIA